ncbi:hypothetical protein PIB30_010083 [Stylosanthes scabra]|uniref:Uncharacterized protein n=1 Tax=Stylosanthes scabra TaxID=79078 RepID=A0ABU6X2S0_9FABA|nr:hypothetical protein [Stylosanthes scabra]
MSSCVGCLPAPDDYLGINPSMVHSCQMSWTQSKAVMSQPGTCSIDVPQSDRTDTWSMLDQSISREVTGSGLQPFPRKEPGSITLVPYQVDQTESESTTSHQRRLCSPHPVIHIAPKTVCEKPPISTTAILFSVRRHSLPAAVGIAAQPLSSPFSTLAMCILHLVTHLLMVHPNPNPKNLHFPQPRSPPPIAVAGAWRSIT